jgi:hypothetical protein
MIRKAIQTAFFLLRRELAVGFAADTLDGFFGV